MLGIEKPDEMTPKARRQEIAEFLVKVFLPLRKRVDYREIIRRAHAETAIARSDSCPEDSSQDDLILPAHHLHRQGQLQRRDIRRPATGVGL